MAWRWSGRPDEIHHYRLGAAQSRDVVPKGEGELKPVGPVPALHPDVQEAVQTLVGPRLDLGGRFLVEPDVRGPEPGDVLRVGQQVGRGPARAAAPTEAGLVDLEPPAGGPDDLADVEVGAYDHVDAHPIPAVELAPQPGLETARERVRRRDDELARGRGPGRRQLMPGDLVDHRHGPLGTEVVERLPLPDALLLDGEGRDVRHLPREVADDGHVGNREAGAGLDHADGVLGCASVAADARPYGRARAVRGLRRGLVSSPRCSERSHSGLVQRFAKPPSGVTCSEGSNPSLSARPPSRAPVAQWIER